MTKRQTVKKFGVFLCPYFHYKAIDSQTLPLTATLRQRLFFHKTFVPKARKVRDKQ
jgi:hypothetical protein